MQINAKRVQDRNNEAKINRLLDFCDNNGSRSSVLYNSKEGPLHNR